MVSDHRRCTPTHRKFRKDKEKKKRQQYIQATTGSQWINYAFLGIPYPHTHTRLPSKLSLSSALDHP